MVLILVHIADHFVEEHRHNIEDRVRKLELGNRELENENIELRENFIKLQSHSMKYNLIFSGILQRDNEKSVYRFLFINIFS
jgi:hypothetical protein